MHLMIGTDLKSETTGRGSGKGSGRSRKDRVRGGGAQQAKQTVFCQHQNDVQKRSEGWRCARDRCFLTASRKLETTRKKSSTFAGRRR